VGDDRHPPVAELAEAGGQRAVGVHRLGDHLGEPQSGQLGDEPGDLRPPADAHAPIWQARLSPHPPQPPPPPHDEPELPLLYELLELLHELPLLQLLPLLPDDPAAARWISASAANAGSIA
jgi:hypothetical protein